MKRTTDIYRRTNGQRDINAPKIKRSSVSPSPLASRMAPPAGSGQGTKKPSSKTIQINLTIPYFQRHPLVKRFARIVRASTRRHRLIALGIALLCIIAAIYSAGGVSTRNTAEIGKGPENPLDKLERGTPDYGTVLPQDKSIDELGGWTRVSPPASDPVFAYVDRIGPTSISVSEQPLPASFKNDPDGQVRTLALGYNATKTITAGSITAYIGSSTTGQQSVIFRKDDLLILIKASTAVADEEWKKYIQSLS